MKMARNDNNNSYILPFAVCEKYISTCQNKMRAARPTGDAQSRLETKAAAGRGISKAVHIKSVKGERIPDGRCL